MSDTDTLPGIDEKETVQRLAKEMRDTWAVEESHRGIFQFAVEFMIDKMKENPSEEGRVELG